MSGAASKAERLAIILERLRAAPPCKSAEEALELVNATVDAVEDELSGVAFDPDAAEKLQDGRMYGPHPRYASDYKGRAELTRYAHTAHDTFIQADGAFLIRLRRPPRVLLSKPGAGGREIEL